MTANLWFPTRFCLVTVYTPYTAAAKAAKAAADSDSAAAKATAADSDSAAATAAGSAVRLVMKLKHGSLIRASIFAPYRYFSHFPRRPPPPALRSFICRSFCAFGNPASQRYCETAISINAVSFV